jgi:hypothetical protein
MSRSLIQLILFFIPTFYCSFCPAYFLLNPFRHRLLFCRLFCFRKEVASNIIVKDSLEYHQAKAAEQSNSQKKNLRRFFFSLINDYRK